MAHKQAAKKPLCEILGSHCLSPAGKASLAAQPLIVVFLLMRVALPLQLSSREMPLQIVTGGGGESREEEIGSSF